MDGELLPTELVRRLAEHPQVLLNVGKGHRLLSGKGLCAASETQVFLLVTARGPMEQKLMEDGLVEVKGGAEDASWTLSMRGRAAIGLPLAAHPLRGDLEVWLPDRAHPRAWVVAEFFPEFVECALPSAAGPQRFFGPTPLARKVPGPGTVWLRACFDGVWFVLLAGLVSPWLMLGYWGVGMKLRPLALGLVSVGVMGLIAAGNLWARAALRRAERAGRKESPHTAILRRGLITPQSLEHGAILALAVGVVGVCGTALWGWELTAVTLVCSGAWALWPWFALRMMRDDEDDDPGQKR